MSDGYGFQIIGCKEGHAPVLYSVHEDCPACKEISKRLTEVNALEIKLAIAEEKITRLTGTVASLNNKIYDLQFGNP